MSRKDKFILIESFKYNNENLVELQRFDKRRKLLEHKTQAQLEEEWEREYYEHEIDDNQETDFLDENNQCRVSIGCYWEAGIRYECLDKAFFDENGRAFKHERYVNGCLECFVVHKFDKKGNHIAMLWYDGAGRLTSRLSYLIRNNRMLEEKCFGGNGHLCWTRCYIYNQNGQIIEQNTYKRKLLFYKIITGYDENNRKITHQKFIHKDYIKKWNMNTRDLGFMLCTK